MHATAQTDMTVLGATSLHASRRSASDSQGASENLLRLDMYSLSYPSLAQPLFFMRQVLNDVFLRKSDS